MKHSIQLIILCIIFSCVIYYSDATEYRCSIQNFNDIFLFPFEKIDFHFNNDLDMKSNITFCNDLKVLNYSMIHIYIRDLHKTTDLLDQLVNYMNVTTNNEDAVNIVGLVKYIINEMALEIDNNNGSTTNTIQNSELGYWRNKICNPIFIKQFQVVIKMRMKSEKDIKYLLLQIAHFAPTLFCWVSEDGIIFFEKFISIVETQFEKTKYSEIVHIISPYWRSAIDTLKSLKYKKIDTSKIIDYILPNDMHFSKTILNKVVFNPEFHEQFSFHKEQLYRAHPLSDMNERIITPRVERRFKAFKDSINRKLDKTTKEFNKNVNNIKRYMGFQGIQKEDNTLPRVEAISPGCVNVVTYGSVYEIYNIPKDWVAWFRPGFTGYGENDCNIWCPFDLRDWYGTIKWYLFYYIGTIYKILDVLGTVETDPNKLWIFAEVLERQKDTAKPYFPYLLGTKVTLYPTFYTSPPHLWDPVVESKFLTTGCLAYAYPRQQIRARVQQLGTIFLGPALERFGLLLGREDLSEHFRKSISFMVANVTGKQGYEALDPVMMACLWYQTPFFVICLVIVFSISAFFSICFWCVSIKVSKRVMKSIKKNNG